MTDTFVAQATQSVRRSLFLRLRGLGLSQSELTRLVAGGSKAAVKQAQVADLAVAAAAAGPVVAALQAAAPGDPALAGYQAVRDSLPSGIQQIVDYVEP